MNKIYEIWYHSTIDQERLVQAFYSKELALKEMNRLNNQFPHSSFYSLREVIVNERGMGCVFGYLFDVAERLKEKQGMDTETELLIRDVTISELREQLDICQAENDRLKQKLNRIDKIIKGETYEY